MDAREKLLERLNIAKRQPRDLSRRDEPPCYYPEAQIREIVDIELIKSILGGISMIRVEQRSLYASLIQEHALTIFSILCFIGHEGFICDFMNQRLYDTKLCFDASQLAFLPSASDHDVRSQFTRAQWSFRPFLFERGMVHSQIMRQTILPYRSDDYNSAGGYGSIYKVELDPDCHNLFDGRGRKYRFVARKEVKVAETDVHNERAVLEMLRDVRHENLIELLASYHYDDTHNFIFPWAEEDLQTWLSGSPIIEPDAIYYQLYGLSQGLKQIHFYKLSDGDTVWRRIGYHHDLRPANILRIGERLVIADFGLAALKPVSQTSKDPLKGGVDEYLSPEARHEDFHPGKVGRSHDIWALGCIMAEILTVMQKCSLDEFRNARKMEIKDNGIVTTDQRYYHKGSIKEGVEQWFDKLVQEDRNRTPKLPQFASLVRRMLRYSPADRPGIEAVVKDMAVISFQVKTATLSASFQRYDTVTRPNAGQACLFLEAKRFAAIRRAYERLLDKSADNFDIVACKGLVDMVQLQQELRTLDGVAWDQGFDKPIQIETICQLLDQLSKSLPLHLAEEVQKSWSIAIAAIDDPDTLAMFKGLPISSRYRDIGVKSVMKLMAQAVSSAIAQGREMMLRDPAMVELSDPSRKIIQNLALGELEEFRTTATFFQGQGQGHGVLIEWRRYHLKWQDCPSDQQLDQLNSMARLLSTKNRPIGSADLFPRLVILDCLGFYHDHANHRFGFVYDLPAHKHYRYCEFPRTYSVHEYIHDTSTSRSNMQEASCMRPYLGAIFQLASDLAGTVYALHNTGWLHKSISSYNILMFCSREHAFDCFSSSVLAGFVQSRPESSEYSLREVTPIYSFYDHPQYEELASASLTDNSSPSAIAFKRSFDYYSLGVVLLELGLWRTASDLTESEFQPSTKRRKVVNHPALSTDSISGRLIRLIPKLGQRMGESYMHAVRFCLTAKDLTEDTAAGREQCAKLFEINVIDQLARCSA